MAIRKNLPNCSFDSANPAPMTLSSHLHSYIAKYLSLYIRPGDSLTEINPSDESLAVHFPEHRTEANVNELRGCKPTKYYLLNAGVHREKDIQKLLEKIHEAISADARLIITFYSALWRPLVKLATKLKLRAKLPEENWVTPDDLANLLCLTNFEPVRMDSKVLCPIYIPVLSGLVNRWLAPLPGFRIFNMVNLLIARPLLKTDPGMRPSVSVIVAARNESGNIDNILRRCPKMGPDDELIFVEGNSTDDTWQKICDATEKYKGPLKIITARQDGKGKGDAVRKGFSLATKDILMILDADLTVPPEDLPKFYNAIAKGKGEFINGSRLVYPMEKEAMRFFNILGNKFFATAFSFVLNQKFKDTLCGTKVLTRENYLRLAASRSYFGEFDPFGDFDLIFGAARLGLKIVEVPIRYRERTYGDTNIQRWKHGLILLQMLMFAARKIKFI